MVLEVPQGELSMAIQECVQKPYAMSCMAVMVQMVFLHSHNCICPLNQSSTHGHFTCNLVGRRYSNAERSTGR